MAQPTGYEKYQGQGLNANQLRALAYFFYDSLMLTITDSGAVFTSYDGGHQWTHNTVLGRFHEYNKPRAEYGNNPGYGKTPNAKKEGVLNSATDTLWAVGDGGKVMFTSNGGTNWVQQVSGIAGDIFCVDFPDNSNGWAADIQGHLIHTTNAGNTWVLQPNDIGFSVGRMFFADLLNGWATGYYSGTSSTVKYTSNGGTNWVDRTPPGPFDPYSYFSRIQFIDQNTGWIVGENFNRYCMFRTTNGGVHWDSCTVNPAPRILNGISFVNALTGYVCGDTLIFKTTNGGVNWISQVLPLHTPNIYDIQFANPDTGFAVGQFATILHTTTGGAPIGITPISIEVPKGYALSQNFPNPFNPLTNIQFAIPKSTSVKLVVYDMLGQEMEALVNEELKAGTYKADWNPSNYTSGVYFYKLTTNEFTETKKMILVK